MKKLKLPKFFKNKRNIVLLIAGGILIIISVIFAIISPTIRTERIAFAGATTTDQILTNNNSFTFTNKGNSSIYVSNEAQSHWAWKNEIMITDITEGTHTFEIHSMKNFIFFKLISAESTIISIDFDYTKPELFDIANVKDEYYVKDTSFIFATKEPYLSIAKITDEKEIILFAENMENPICTVAKQEGTTIRHFTCPIKFVDSETLTKTVYAKDLAGNIYYFFKDQLVKYIEPVSLGCAVPQFTNQLELTVSCAVTKDGFYEMEDLQEPITKGQEISKVISLQEGENTVTYKTFDNEDREFEDSYIIILDTVKPTISFDKLPTTVDYWDKFSIQFHTDESTTGTIYIRPDAKENKPTVVYNETYYKNLTLTTENAFNHEAHIDGSYSSMCYMLGFGECDTFPYMILTVTLTDRAGNKVVENHKIKVTGSYYGF